MRKVELVLKGRALPYITNEGSSGRSIRTYLQRWELNINDSVRKYYNRLSDYLTGSRSSNNGPYTKYVTEGVCLTDSHIMSQGG